MRFCRFGLARVSLEPALCERLHVSCYVLSFNPLLFASPTLKIQQPIVSPLSLIRLSYLV